MLGNLIGSLQLTSLIIDIKLIALYAVSTIVRNPKVLKPAIDQKIQ